MINAAVLAVFPIEVPPSAMDAVELLIEVFCSLRPYLWNS